MSYETSEAVKTIAAALREPFPDSVIGKLPRVTCPNCRKAPGKVCDKHSKSKCNECGNWITSAHMHLDYVGHAAITDRLLQVDPTWTWEPVSVDDHGSPLVQERNGTCRLWIRLTVAGVTRLGVGTCEAKKSDIEKELIGDALRNAAMRFGVALDLWSKELLGAEDNDEKEEPPKVDPLTDNEVEAFEAGIQLSTTTEELDTIAAKMKERGVTGDNREMLGAQWKKRREEMEGE